MKSYMTRIRRGQGSWLRTGFYLILLPAQLMSLFQLSHSQMYQNMGKTRPQRPRQQVRKKREKLKMKSTWNNEQSRKLLMWTRRYSHFVHFYVCCLMSDLYLNCLLAYQIRRYVYSSYLKLFVHTTGIVSHTHCFRRRKLLILWANSMGLITGSWYPLLILELR